MSNRTIIGTALAATLTASVLGTALPSSAAPTWVGQKDLSGVGALPAGATVAMAPNGAAVAAWVREVNGVDRVLAASASGGTWGPAQYVSHASDGDSANPSVALNAKGAAVVTWTMKDNADHTRLALAPRRANGTWDGRTLVNGVGTNVSSLADVDMDDSGRVLAAYSVTPAGQATSQVEVATWRPNQAPSQVQLSDTSSYVPALDVNASGDAVVAWFDAGNGQSEIAARYLHSGGSTWGAPDVLSPAGQHQAHVDVAIDNGGRATVGYVQQTGGDYRVWTTKYDATGKKGGETVASPAGHDASQVSIAQNGHGTAFAAWVQDATGVGHNSRPLSGGWGTAQLVNENVASPTQPRAALGDNGRRLIAFTGNGRLVAAHQHGVTPWQVSESAPLGYLPTAGVGIDNQGNGVVVAARQTGADQGQVLGTFLDGAGPSVSVTAPATTKSVSFTVKRSAADRFSAVTTGSVRVRSATWSGTFGKHTLAQDQKAATSLKYAGLPGRTYCFSTQARDAVANHSAWSGEKCTTTPVDDRALTRTGGFTREKGSAHYRGTFSQAKKTGAVLKITGARAKRIGVLVGKHPNGGKIEVWFGTQKIGRYSLKGSGPKHLVANRTFAAVKKGSLRIKVISGNGKPVRIDGVVIAK